MGKKVERNRSKTLPSSPTHSLSSSSSSDFEFRISISPRKSSAALCPADELFYKGQLLPLHLSPRISMVRNLLASSSSSSSSDTTTTASRDSSSSNDSTSSSFTTDLSLLAVGDPCCDSSRPSSVTDDDKLLTNCQQPKKSLLSSSSSTSSKYFSLSRFSSVFKKDTNTSTNNNNSSTGATPTASTNNNDHPMMNSNKSEGSSFKKMSSSAVTTTSSNKSDGSSVKKMSSSAKEVIRKYLKKVKPLYEKLSSKPADRRRETFAPETTAVLLAEEGDKKEIDAGSGGAVGVGGGGVSLTTSFSGNLKCPKMIKRSYVASCPSSMRSSPSHSGVLTRAGMPVRAGLASYGSGSYSSETSTMEELQNAIQGAIAHCKNSMLQSSSSSFNHMHHNVNTKGKAIQI